MPGVLVGWFWMTLHGCLNSGRTHLAVWRFRHVGYCISSNHSMDSTCTQHWHHSGPWFSMSSSLRADVLFCSLNAREVGRSGSVWLSVWVSLVFSPEEKGKYSQKTAQHLHRVKLAWVRHEYVNSYMSEGQWEGRAVSAEEGWLVEDGWLCFGFWVTCASLTAIVLSMRYLLIPKLQGMLMK